VRVALYARVSTTDKGQDVETQFHALRLAATARQWDVVGEWSDEASANDLRGRRAWRELLATAKRGGIDAIAVLRLDRAFRSTLTTHETLALLATYGVAFVSITQPIDTTTPAGKLILAVIAALAEFEKDLISQRVREGIARARAEGQVLGRPRGSKDKGKRQTLGYNERWANDASRRRKIQKEVGAE